MSTRLVVMGGGRMGEALTRGLLRAGWVSPSELVVVEPRADRRRELGASLPGVAVAGEASAAEAAVLATKPADLEMAARSLTGVFPPPGRVLSIAAGVPLQVLEAWLPDPVVVMRAMPNVGALVGASATALAPGSRASEEDAAWGESVLAALGTVRRVPERLLDAVTGLSGSGPAYLLLVTEALVEAGVLVGLARDDAAALARQTVVGTGRLLAETDASPEELRASVTSPGGTTAAGLAVLEDRATRGARLAAVAAATARAVELGRGVAAGGAGQPGRLPA